MACAGGNSDGLEVALVLVVSSDLAVGKERVLVSAIDAKNRSLVTDQPVEVAFVAPDGSGRPSVIVFTTPAFCTSGTCGPVLDVAKPPIDVYSGGNWVHVEMYENLHASGPDDLELTRAVVKWGLPNEPWTFVVDGAGIVTHRFEGVLDDAELVVAPDRVTS